MGIGQPMTVAEMRALPDRPSAMARAERECKRLADLYREGGINWIA